MPSLGLAWSVPQFLPLYGGEVGSRDADVILKLKCSLCMNGVRPLHEYCDKLLMKQEIAISV